MGRKALPEKTDVACMVRFSRKDYDRLGEISSKTGLSKAAVLRRLVQLATVEMFPQIKISDNANTLT